MRFSPGRVKLPAALLPPLFVIVYLGMYGAAKFSLPGLRTPRYLLPLCPFVSIAIATVVAGWTGGRRWAGLAAILFLVVTGAAASLQIGLRPWHEEHLVRTSGAEIAKLAAAVQERGIRVAFAPYEIQWRLMFATDERVGSLPNGSVPGRRSSVTRGIRLTTTRCGKWSARANRSRSSSGGISVLRSGRRRDESGASRAMSGGTPAGERDFHRPEFRSAGSS